jgi:N-acetylglutamate synthase-like GNAT family acetyltransferase
MLQIYKGNRVKYEPKRLAQTVREFEEVLSGQSKEFDLLTHNGEMIAFIRFDKQPNGNLYAGSLNVRPEARSSQIGMALLRATLDKKAETHNIEAVAHSKLPMLKHYTEDFGFEITGELPNYHGQEMYYQLFRPKQSRKSRPEAA